MSTLNLLFREKPNASKFKVHKNVIRTFWPRYIRVIRKLNCFL